MTPGPEGFAELDPEQVLEKVVRVAGGTLQALGARAGSLEGVAVSCFWHSLIGLDRQGRALTPVLMWADLRSARQAGVLRKRLGRKKYLRRTGCALHPAYWPSKLLWLREKSPRVYGRVRRWVSMDGYVLGKLQGEYGSGHAMAAGTGLYDQGKRDWDEAILRELDISRDRLPKLRPFSRPRRGLRKSYLESLPALAGVPVYPALPDGYCAQVGSGCRREGRAALTLGTSGALRVMAAGGSLPAVPEGLWCYRVERDRFLVGGAVNNVGNLFTWLKKTFSLPPPERWKGASTRLTEVSSTYPPGTHGLTVLPFLHGERSPDWPLEAFGVVSGLRASTRPEQVYQAFFESSGFQLGRIYRLLEAGGLIREEEIRVSGGLREPFLLNAFAHVVGRPLRILPEREVSSLGAVKRVMAALGVSPGEGDESGRTSGQRFEPAEEHRPACLAEAERQESLNRLYREGRLFF